MVFDIVKCALLIMKRRKRERTEGTELLNQERIRTFGEKENHKCLVTMKVETIKPVEI